MDVFSRYPIFIDSDPRTERKHSTGYTVTHDLMLQRHDVLLPKEMIQNRSVLDLGCCVAATGAWVLDAGASDYTGVDIQKNFTDLATKNLSSCFPEERWKIVESSLEDFLEHNDQKFDIICAFGVIYSSLYYQDIIRRISEITQHALVIESMFPPLIRKNIDLDPSAEHWPVTEYVSDLPMMYDKDLNVEIRSNLHGPKALAILLDDLGFEADYRSYHRYRNKGFLKYRFGMTFNKKQSSRSMSIKTHADDRCGETRSWDLKIPDSWKFDENIAKIFVQHARQHIPDYDTVIDLSVEFCKNLLENPLEDRIIDVGCATGETISRLYQNGCCNIIGVDSSQSMLDRCNPTQAFYVLSDDFPIDHGPYDAVLCNWTLHFIQDKKSYLEKIYHNLNPGGFLIISDKTQDQGIFLELYHRFKLKNGVSPEEIEAKARSLKNTMFIDPPSWYIDTLRSIGFNRVDIFNAAPCFTSFIAFKA